MAKKTGRVSHGVAVSALFSAMALLYGTAAYGSFYPGHIDPGGNGTIPGFNGNAVFDIQASCVPVEFTGWLATNQNTGTSAGCGNAFVYSANIDLYTVSPSDPPTPGIVQGTFNLSAEPTDFWPVLGVYVLNGALDGVDTNAMGPNVGTGAWATHNFWLQFVSGFCQFGCTAPGNFIDGTADISMDNINSFGPSGPVIFGTPCPNPNNCTVPEPGTLALVATAVGGGWLIRRRKGKTAASS